MTFEFLVAIRYLRAKRKQAAISLITFIAILGVGAGVAALVVAMAVSEGQRGDIRDRLLGEQAHLSITAGSQGIMNYEAVAKEIEQVKDVVAAAPHSERNMAIPFNGAFEAVLVKGIIPALEARISKLPERIEKGQYGDLKEKESSIIIGKGLADKLGLGLRDDVELMSPVLAPGAMGMRPNGLTSAPPVLPVGTSPNGVLVAAPATRSTCPAISRGLRWRSPQSNISQCTRMCSQVDA